MKRVSICLLAALALLLLNAAVCSANLISYTTWSANRDKLMVMDESGANPVELFLGGKFSPLDAFPSISPKGMGDTWVLFKDYYDLYRIRPDGNEQTLVLCGEGEDKFGDPYFLSIYGAEWSPGGSEVLVHVWPSMEDSETSLALIPATHVAEQAAVCSSDLVPIYPEPGSHWSVEPPAAWNHDGSRIAFAEMNTLTEEYRFSIIERQLSGAWQVVDSFVPISGSPDIPPGASLLFLDWQPGGNLLVFRLRGSDERRPPFWLASIDLDSHRLDYVLDKGSRIEMDVASSPSWSSDGSQILFTDPGGNLVKWTYPDGDREVIGSGDWAYWQLDVVVGICGDGDCAGSETRCNCALDCGAHPSDEAGLCTDSVDNDCDGPVDCDDSDCQWDEACPFCGDFACNGNETECSCSVDCGTPSNSEAGLCSDGLDNDCDLDVDCDDSDCSNDTACTSTCGVKGETCATGADCCSGSCHPRKGCR